MFEEQRSDAAQVVVRRNRRRGRVDGGAGGRRHHIAHANEAQPLQRAIAADEVRDERVGRMREQFVRRRELHESPGVEDRDAIRHLHRLVDVVAHEQDRLAQLLLHPQELVLDHLAIDGIERGERLVHQQHRRIDRQRARDTDPLRLAAGELVRIAVDELTRRQRQHRQELLGASAPSARIPTEKPRHDADILGDRHVRKKPDLLDHVADAAAQLDRVDGIGVAARDEDLAGGRRDEPVDHAQRRRLAATGRTEQHARFAFAHLEAHAVDGRHAPLRGRIDSCAAIRAGSWHHGRVARGAIPFGVSRRCSHSSE